MTNLMGEFEWTPERVAELTKLWATGLSASFSMAIIGIGHLVGLSVGVAMLLDAEAVTRAALPPAAPESIMSPSPPPPPPPFSTSETDAVPAGTAIVVVPPAL